MKAALLRRAVVVSTIGAAAALSSSCVSGGTGFGDGYSNQVDIGVDYYEPFGIAYGGWGPGYRVGPYRGGEREFNRGGAGGRPGSHAYRTAPAGRSAPSIPGRAGGGGGRR